MTTNQEAIVGAVAWLANADRVVRPMPLCPIQRLRHWSSSCDRCEDAQLSADVAWAIAAGFVRWYMPGVLTLTAPGERIARSVIARCAI